MKNRVHFRRITCGLVALLYGLTPVWAQIHSAQANKASCRDFVRSFYDWYAPKARDMKVNSLELALTEKGGAFDPALVRMLKSSEAENPPGEAWLDFDPVLNTQDPYEEYAVEKVTVQGYSCWASIHAVIQSKMKNPPEVKAELLTRNGKWMFVDFHYPNTTFANNESLIKILRYMRQAARKRP